MHGGRTIRTLFSGEGISTVTSSITVNVNVFVTIRCHPIVMAQPMASTSFQQKHTMITIPSEPF
jgi:hypothetical protein